MIKSSVFVASAGLAVFAASALTQSAALDVRATMQTEVNPAMLAIWDVGNNALNEEGGIDPALMDAEKWARVAQAADQLAAAARDAAILPFIEMLPQGFDTEVGERGLKLSGGEKQRVAIARTLLKNPPILLLDEATSALDTRTEQDILATLHRVSEHRTTIAIAHRLSTVADADTIFVLDHGRLAESGSHTALLRQDGLYAEMWNRQLSEREEGLEEAAE